MKILVTGASGFIGQHLVARLLADGHEVIAAGRDRQRISERSWSGSIAWFPLDIEASPVDLFQRAGKPDALIHAAWGRLDDYRDAAHFESLLMHHYRFIRDLVAAGLQHCLVLGTCLEYGLREGALQEDMDAKPVLAYPLAKHLLRQMLGGLQQSLPFTLQWVRVFYLHGAGQRPGSLLAQVDAALAEGRETFAMSKGDQLRDYLPVGDVATNIAAVVSRPEFGGIINCCSGKPISVRELVEAHLQARGASLQLDCGRYSRPDYEPFAFWGDRTRLDALLAGAVP